MILLISRFGELFSQCCNDIKAYERLITSIGGVVGRSSQDEEYRFKLASSRKLWETLQKSLNCVEQPSINDDKLCFFYVRSIRALILLMRNLSVSNQEIPQTLLLQNSVIRSVLLGASVKCEKVSVSLYTLSLEFLHNITKESVIFDENEIDSLMCYLKYPLQNLNEMNQEILLTYALLFLNLTASDDFLYHFVRHCACCTILCDILVEQIAQKHSSLFHHLHQGPTVDEKFEISTMDAVILRLFANLSSNESFGRLVTRIEERNTAQLINVLRLVQLAITSKESWNNATLTGVLSWCFPCFQKTGQLVKEYFALNFENNQTAEILHDKLSITLDIIASLSHYDHVQEFLLSYDGLEELISLLKSLQENLIRVNIHKNVDGSVKSTNITTSSGEKVTDQSLLNMRYDRSSKKILPTNFPECKSLIIEILSMLTHKRTNVQDKIRQLHGLELVLSNCVIDDNDPFIKERSIVCIKFLLQDNKENQDFVAKLEAKKPVQDEIISEAGFEIKIGDTGSVSLKAKERIE